MINFSANNSNSFNKEWNSLWVIPFLTRKTLSPEVMLTKATQEKILKELSSDTYNYLKAKLPKYILEFVLPYSIYYYHFKKYNDWEIFFDENYKLSDSQKFVQKIFKKLNSIWLWEDEMDFKNILFGSEDWAAWCYYFSWNFKEPKIPYFNVYDDPNYWWYEDEPFLYNDFQLRISDIAPYYIVSFWKYDKTRAPTFDKDEPFSYHPDSNKYYSIYEPEIEEERKYFEGIDVIMKEIWYSKIDEKLLKIVLPVQWDLYSSIPTPENWIDRWWSEAYWPYTLRHLLFGE
ncbi:MAG: hypothetical protein ACD_4C00012G0004 [uncultured bacterium (gcode 4)]|uniref:Uncharacterized protein n=1 Tax=uncultured bacterium (gcode 4) TaxID=1234023 RepID=K2GV63_9BACT|nr:MAG: hypothetical protein ACD_4C00012G0004 [uncultured bacterium (gcode 4)]